MLDIISLNSNLNKSDEFIDLINNFGKEKTFCPFQDFFLKGEDKIAYTYLNTIEIDEVIHIHAYIGNVNKYCMKPDEEIIIDEGKSGKANKLKDLKKYTIFNPNEVPSMIKLEDIQQKPEPKEGIGQNTRKLYLEIGLEDDQQYVCLNNNITKPKWEISELLERKNKKELINWYKDFGGFGDNIVIIK